MFDTGLLTVCTLIETNENGGKPVKQLEKKCAAFYGERTVSAARLYQARGADCEIDMLVRVPFDTDVQTNDYVVLENDDQFRVDFVSKVLVGYSNRALELTLVRLGVNYNASFNGNA